MNQTIAIIGGGPAGMACAIQLKRYGLNPVIFEKNRLGGLLHNANLVENYAGFPAGIAAVNLIKKFTEHINRLSIEVKIEKIFLVEEQNGMFRLTTNNDKIYNVETLVVASGTRPKFVQEFENRPSLDGHIFYEIAVLKNLSGKKIGIIGTGDAAFDYALNLAGDNHKVQIFNRGQSIKSIPLLIERVHAKSSITYHPNHQLIDIIKSKNNPHQIVASFNVNNSTVNYLLEYIIFATGRKPSLAFLSDEIKNNLDNLYSSKKLFLIGDVKNEIFRQVSIATGDGVRAAMEIYKTMIEA